MLEVKIAGHKIKDIYSISIDYDIRACSNIFALSISFEKNDKDIFTPFLYPKIEIIFNDKTIFVGIVENISKTIRDRGIILGGRSKTAFLSDCNFMKNYIYNNMTLSNICKYVCSDYEINVSSPFGDSETFKKIQFSMFENVFSQLSEVASMSVIKNTIPLLSTGLNGDLIIGKNITDDTVVLDISESSGSLLDGRAFYNGSKRHSEYKRFSQSIGNANIASNKIIDKKIKLKKPDYEICSALNIGQCNNKAAIDRAADISNSNFIEIGLGTWIDKNKNIIETGKLILLESPSCLINEKQKFLIEKIKLNYGSMGFSSIMKLSPADTYMR